MLGFAVSASIAGVAGAMIAYRSGGASPDRFDYLQSLVFFAYAYLGGISSVAGAIIGGVIVSGGLLWTFLLEVVGISSRLHVPARRHRADRRRHLRPRRRRRLDARRVAVDARSLTAQAGHRQYR